MVLEATYAMLVCARIGAVHSVVFGGFSWIFAWPDSRLRFNIYYYGRRGLRGGKKFHSKKIPMPHFESCPDVKTVLVLKRTGGTVNWNDKRGYLVAWHCRYPIHRLSSEPMNAEDPLFILTSGSTGKPKGVLHTTGGYMVYTLWPINGHLITMTVKSIGTADVGWVTGHSILFTVLPMVQPRLFWRRPELSGLVTVLASRRQAQSQYFLYRTDCHSLDSPSR